MNATEKIIGYELSMDYENNAETFWLNFDLVAADYDAIEYDGETWYFLDEKNAKKFWADCEKIEGWWEPDMPEYASTPLVFREITEDELPQSAD